MSVWGAYDAQIGECLHWRVGPWQLWLERTADEWLAATRRSADEETGETVAAEPGEKPAELPWRRWTSGKESSQVHLLPAMPDRAVVARPEAPIRILPRQDGTFFVSIPVSARVAVGASAETLFEEPTVIMSKTWFGEPSAGELCYALHTRARRENRPEDNPPHRAVCPVLVRNATEAQLDFRRLCLRVNYLKVFAGEAQLWTNQARVLFKGADAPSRVDYGADAPPFEKDLRLLCDSRKPLTRSILKDSFDTFINLTGFGV